MKLIDRREIAVMDIQARLRFGFDKRYGPVEEVYPASIQLFFIIVAVVFSIFLAALDQVGPLTRD